MLKDRIVALCQNENITVKKMILDLKFTEQSIYRWFKKDTMEIKNLRKIADYFGKDLIYFFSNEENNLKNYEKSKNIQFRLIEDKEAQYAIKDKYIESLEEISRLQKENAQLKEKIAWYTANCECDKTKQASAKIA